MKKILTTIVKYCGLFLLLIAIFNVAFYMVSLIDSELLKENVVKSSKILKKEWYNYKISDMFDVENDTYVDAVILNAAYSMDNKTPYLSYMKIRRDYKRGYTFLELPEHGGEGIAAIYDEYQKEETFDVNDSISELEDFLDGKIHHSPNYGRYWHGYLVLLRPLLLVFDVMGIRYFMLLVFVMLLAYLSYLLYKEFGKNIAFIFAISLICSGYFSAAYSLGDITLFLVMMVSSIVLLKRIDKIKSFNTFIFIVGCVSNFVDFLRVPLITLGVPCAIYLLKLMNDKKDWKYCVKTLIMSSFVWFIAYASTWIFKWFLYDLTIADSNNMLEIGFEQVLYRTTRINEAFNEMHGDSFSCLAVIYKMISKSFINTIMAAIVILALNLFKVSFKLDKNVIPFLILSLYPIIWFLSLANHTIMHSFFVYRLTLLFMLSMLICLYKLFLPKEMH